VNALLHRCRLRHLWLLLALAVASQHLVVFHRTQNLPAVLMLALLVWGASWICLEDHWEDLEPLPSGPSLLAGTLLLIWILWRTALVASYDSLLYITPPLAMVGLALLLRPLRRLGQFRESLVIALLLPVWLLVVKLFPEQPLSLFTARASALMLQLLGLAPQVSGRVISFAGGGGSVRVEGICNGLEVIYQALAVAIIFLVCFPLRRAQDRLAILLLAPLVGLVSNVFRIALLGLIVAIGGSLKESSFEFWHKGSGSLVFSGLSVLVIGLIYSRFVNRQLQASP
jgi:cyanoexosortase A